MAKKVIMFISGTILVMSIAVIVLVQVIVGQSIKAEKQAAQDSYNEVVGIALYNYDYVKKVILEDKTVHVVISSKHIHNIPVDEITKCYRGLYNTVSIAAESSGYIDYVKSIKVKFYDTDGNYLYDHTVKKAK